MAETAQPRHQADIHRESLTLAKKMKNGIIPYMEDEIQTLESNIAKFRAGEYEEKVFIPLRLRQGTYGQRQPDRQMIRVKLPGGIITPEALEAFGEAIEQYAPLKKGHLTTRENLQVHHMKLEDCSGFMRVIAEAGLSSREGCGNTVRNVTGSPLAGICPDETFDPTPYLAAYVRFGLRHPVTQSFPRKWKTSFSGCGKHDEVVTLINDFSFVAKIKDGKKGFKVYIGGGTSIMPRLAKTLYEFIPAEDILRVSLASWTVFNKADMLRKNRMMARIKVLVDKIGIEAVRAQVDEELKSIGPIDPTPYMGVDDIYKETPPAVSKNGHQHHEPDFAAWRKTNVVAQKQKGYYAVYANIPSGDIHTHQYKPLAELLRRYTGGRGIVTPEQNILLRWIPEANLYDVWKGLKALGFANPGVNAVTDVITCPGTDSCKLGITSTMGLGRALMDAMKSWGDLLNDPLIQKVHIKGSGCPNGCGQHHIANIGFHGAAMKGPGGQQVPSYEVFLGGNYGMETHVDGLTFGKRLSGVKVPSKRTPDFVKDVLTYYKENRNPGEEFNPFVARVGLKPFEALAAKHNEIPALGPQSITMYMDWDKTILYKVERGEGECAV
ncbi:MAG: nitrite/sulfite reductase [Chloroflexi bacterium]|nr:nitrite/sulfite reductase [Chloroflexota bacterium]